MHGVSCSSGVPETPWDKETLIGAENRAEAARRSKPEADLALGLESGLVQRYGMVFEECWACAISHDGAHRYGFSSGLRVPPPIVSAMLEDGLPHAEIMRRLDSDPELGRDTWAVYSSGRLNRATAIMESARNALVGSARIHHLDVEASGT